MCVFVCVGVYMSAQCVLVGVCVGVLVCLHAHNTTPLSKPAVVNATAVAAYLGGGHSHSSPLPLDPCSGVRLSCRCPSPPLFHRFP